MNESTPAEPQTALALPVAVQVPASDGSDDAEEPPSPIGPRALHSAPVLPLTNHDTQRPRSTVRRTPDTRRPPARKRRLAFVCNMRPPAPTSPQAVARAQTEQAVADDEYEEYDSPETVAALARQFAAEGYAVTVLEADRTLPRRLMAGNFDLVFNMAEGKGGRCREALVPALCEMLGLHYTGSDPLTLSATLDKAVAKRLVSPTVATPKWLVVRALSDLQAAAAQGFQLRFPVFAKPNDEGSSKGIRKDARCEDFAQLEAVCTRLLDTYGRPVLVEEFVRGAEVTVGIIGNEQPEVVGMMQVLPRTGPVDEFVYSLEAKREWRTEVRYATPPELPAEWCERLREAALQAYRLLDCRDVARIDFRLDSGGVPHFIEANPLPGLSPVSGDLVLMARAMGWTWSQLVARIVHEAEFRQGVLRPMLVPRASEAARRKPMALTLPVLPLLAAVEPAHTARP